MGDKLLTDAYAEQDKAFWLIKRYDFGYSDEGYYRVGGDIYKFYDNEDEAKRDFISANLQEWGGYVFDERINEAICSGDEKVRDYINQCANKYNVSENELSSNLINLVTSKMSDEENVRLLEIINANFYTMTKFDKKPYFYLLWLAQRNTYCYKVQNTGSDEVFMTILWDYSEERLVDNLEFEYLFEDEWPILLEGTLEELSEHPFLLQKMIDQEKIQYDGQQLTIYAKSEIVAVNGLLKEPLFEVRKLTFDEMSDINNRYFVTFN